MSSNNKNRENIFVETFDYKLHHGTKFSLMLTVFYYTNQYYVSLTPCLFYSIRLLNRYPAVLQSLIKIEIILF